MSPDLINAGFEAGGAMAVALSCRRLYLDKEVRGVSLWAAAWFIMWGWWNLFYYPHLGQLWSTIAAIMVASANTVWIAMAFYYIAIYDAWGQNRISDYLRGDDGKDHL